MLNWLNFLRRSAQHSHLRLGRRSTWHGVPADVCRLEPREMLARLTSSSMGGFPDSGVYYYQSAATLYQQQGSGRNSITDLGPMGSTAHDDPSTVYGGLGANYESDTVSTATITPLPEPDPDNPGSNLYDERSGDAAYIFMYAEASVDTTIRNPPVWSYSASVGSGSLAFDASTPVDSVDDILTARGSRLIKTHLGDTLEFNHRLSDTPELSVNFYATAFTVNAYVQRAEWTTNSSGQHSLTGFIGAGISPFNQQFSSSPYVDTYDPQSGPDAVFPSTKIRLIWSSTPTPSGNLGTAYEYTLGAPNANPFRDRYGFNIEAASLGTAPAGAKYLVMIVDPDGTLWESHEDDNYYEIPTSIITAVEANYDEEQPSNVFGTYLEGVPLDTTFTVKTLDPFHVGKSVRYTITKPDNTKVEGTATATSTPGQYQFKYDVGQLPGGTLPVKFELLNGAGESLPEGSFEGQIIVKDQLDLDFKGAADGNTMTPLDKLRLIEQIGVITDYEVSLTKLPLYDQYKDKFDFVIRDSSSKAEVLRQSITFEKLPQLTRAEVQDWNTENKVHDLREGAEYEAVLSPRDKTTPTFDSSPLNVEKLPKWLSGTIAGNPSSYDYVDNHFIIHASYPPLTSNISLPSPTDAYGLFTGATSQLSAGIEFDVFAPLSTSDPVTAQMQRLAVAVKLLGQDLVPKTTYSLTQVKPIPLENEIKLTDAGPVKIDTGEIQFAKNIKLFDATVGRSKDFSLTQAILSKLGGPLSGIIDLDVSVMGTLDKFFGRGKFTITGTSGDNPQFDSKESFFTVTAEASAEAAANLTASLSIPGATLVSSTIGGTVWVKVVGDAALNFSGAVLTPTITYAEDHTRLAAQFGAKLTVSGQILGHDFVPAQPFTTTSKVYTLFGSESVAVSLKDPESYQTIGDGIVTTGNVARPASVATPPDTFAAMSAPTVSTLTLKTPLNSATSRIQVDYDVTSTIRPLATGRHRLEVVAVPNDITLAETVLGSVDLATLSLSANSSGGFQSAAQTLILNPSAGQLNPQWNQHLVLRLISDPASGETVRLRPSEIAVTVAEPTLNMTAPNGILNDGAIVFGTETAGATKVDLQLTNTGGPMLLVDRLRVEGSNLRLSSTGQLDVYANDLSTPLTVEVINPALPVSGFVKFATNDPTRPEISIPVSYTPPNTAPTIGGLPANQAVNDTATIIPFSGITVNDPNQQNMLAKVTILNGTVRGDFTTASVTGWTRSISGNNIVYSRYYNPQANIGSLVQAALRSFVFVPRSNAIKPNTTELTDITVFVNDGVANTTATTRLTTTSVNNSPTFGGTSANVAVNDNATVNPFTALTVSDVDLQEMLISVTILNGTVRGDFTAASTAGWAVRYVLGNNITYKRYFSPQANVGAAAQAAFRALVFQPRQNAINPGTTEATDFQVTVSDGVAPAVLGTGTRVTTTSVNNAPTIGGAVAGQTMNDNQTKAVFSTLTVTDPDTQAMNVIITIPNGVNRGDFTAGSTTGWTRTVVGVDLRYNRFFNATANIGATVQTAIRALVFQPRSNVPVGTTETTSFTVFLNDGLANTTNSTTSVITTGVAPRVATTAELLILPQDTTTIVLPTIAKPRADLLARRLRKSR